MMDGGSVWKPAPVLMMGCQNLRVRRHCPPWMSFQEQSLTLLALSIDIVNFQEALLPGSTFKFTLKGCEYTFEVKGSNFKIRYN